MSDERESEGWNRWINERIGPNIRQITESEIQQAALEPTDGGTTFVLTVKRESHRWVKKAQKLSAKYRVVNDTTVFVKGKKKKLVAMRSPHCIEEYDHGSIEQFFEDHKFGALHRYDKREYLEVIRTGKPAVFLVVDWEIDDNQMAALRQISDNHCGSLVVGWISAIQDRALLKMIGANRSMVPFVYASGFNKGPSKFYYGRVMDIDKTWFFEELRYGNSVYIRALKMNIAPLVFIGCACITGSLLFFSREKRDLLKTR